MAQKFTIYCDDDQATSFEPEKGATQAYKLLQQQSSSSTSSSTTTSQQPHLAIKQQQQDLTTNQRQPLQAKAGLTELQQAAAVLKSLATKQDKLGKREPLGLKHLEPQQQSQQSQQQKQQQVLQDLSTSSSTADSSTNEEDQENDISMASLGSDYVPSILHDEAEFVEDDSFQLDEEQAISSENTDFSHDHHNYSGALVAEDEFVITDDENDIDEDLQMELKEAFRKAEETETFNCTIFKNDILAYLSELEAKPENRPLPNYMDFQHDIDTNKRAILFDWLVEVSDEFGMQTETVFICTNIVDRFLSLMSVSTSNLQLLGVAAMLIASKYEEIYPPYLHQFVELTDDTYSSQQVRQMEQEVLKTLKFRISLPTVTFYLTQVFAFNKFPKKVYHLAEYLCYLSLLADEFLEYYPSEIAIAAVILAAHQLGASANISSELKKSYDDSNKAQLKRRQLPEGVELRDIDRRSFIVDPEYPFAIESLRQIQECAYSGNLTPQCSRIYTRYTEDSRSRVALIEPPNVEKLRNY